MGLFRSRVGGNEIPDEHQIDVASYGSVVDLVQQLGDAAVSSFLADISPYLDAIQRHEAEADAKLAQVLHAHAISAVVMLESGGIDSFNEQAKVVSEASQGMSAEQVTVEIDRLT